MKRFRTAALALLAVIALSAATALPVSAAVYDTPPPAVKSEAVYMTDYDTGELIYAKNADERRYPASLTKMITALVCMEQLPDWRTRTITTPSWLMDEFAGQIIGTADIEPNETLPLKDAVYATLLPSACEAATLLAYAVDGEDTAAFVARMNDMAARIGAVGTHFANPHGLFDEDHYSTAHDIALIARYAMSVPDFYEVVGSPYYEMSVTDAHPQTRTIETANEMILPTSRYYRTDAYGVKTGTLEAAGRNLASTRQVDGRRYLLVTMGAPLYNEGGALLSYVDQDALYGWAFSTLRRQTPVVAGESVATLPVQDGKDKKELALVTAGGYTVTGEHDRSAEFERVTELPDTLKAPLSEGQAVGTLRLVDRQSGQTVFTTELLTAEGCEKASFPWVWLLLPLGLLLLFGLLCLRAAVVRRRRRRRRRRRTR